MLLGLRLRRRTRLCEIAELGNGNNVPRRTLRWRLKPTWCSAVVKEPCGGDEDVFRHDMTVDDVQRMQVPERGDHLRKEDARQSIREWLPLSHLQQRIQVPFHRLEHHGQHARRAVDKRVVELDDIRVWRNL